jgi:TonB-linked SusC/RagA family outer membrane protein
MKNLITVFFTIFIFSGSIFAQVSTGTVVDSGGLPLPGVNVKVVGKQQATITDIDGKFSLPTVAGDKLEFTSIGFTTQTISAVQGDMKVTLAEEVNKLNEVVVVGFGTQKSGAVTGSIAQVKTADIVKTPAQSAVQAIQGKAAGVNITTNDEPGSNPTIRIRGLGTLIGGRDPLYIIDGVEATGMNGLSPNEIATMDILKDASSLAIYGQKGANGVVIISTKKGKLGKPKVSYDTYYGEKSIQRKVDLADPFRYTYYNNAAIGSTTYFNSNQPYKTDWLDAITRTGEVMSHYVSISGGTDTVNYYFGVTNYQEKGILDGTEYERTNLNSRNSYNLFGDFIKISQNVNVTLGKTTPKPVSAFTNAYKQAPIVPIRFDNGRWGQPLRDPSTGMVSIDGSDRFNTVANPVAQLANSHDQSKNVILSGSVAADINFTKDLKFTSNFGATYETYKGYSYSSGEDAYLTTNSTKSVTDFEESFGINPVIYNTLNQYKGSSYLWNWDNYLTYKKTFGKHELTVVAGMSRSTKFDDDYLSGTRNNVPVQSNYWNLSLSSYNVDTAPGQVVKGTHATPVVSLAYFARAEYAFNDRYLLSAVVRREGISAFQEGKRWDTFPAVSAGWVVSNEDFLKDSKLFNYLKIRGGYGEVGDGNTSNSSNYISFAPNYNYALGSGQVINPGSSIPNLVDKNLTWAKMKEVDLGLDFRMLHNRLSGTIDVYDRTTSNVILPVSLPPVISEGDVTLNAGDVSNKGIEFSLRWEDNLTERLKYWVSGNISYNKNELTKVTNSFFSDYTGGNLDNGQYTKAVLVGQPLGSFYVYDTTGFTSTGDFTYSANRKAEGSYLPTYTGGVSLGLLYRNIDFSVDGYFAGGNKIYNGKKAQRMGNENVESDALDNVNSPSNPSGTNPYPSALVPIASTYYLEDGDYFRINNITLGYTFPNFTDKISKLRLYVTAVNPFLFTKYSGYSPEISGSENGLPMGTAGIELNAYPTNRTFSVGLNLSF